MQEVKVILVRVEVSEIAVVLTVLLLRVGECLDGVAVQLHGELNTLVQDLLRFVCRVDVHQRETLHPLVVMAQGSLNHTVADGLSNNLLSFLLTFQGQLVLNILQVDAAVGNIDFLESKLDHSVLQSLNKGQVPVRSEIALVLSQDLLE